MGLLCMDFVLLVVDQEKVNMMDQLVSFVRDLEMIFITVIVKEVMKDV